MKTDVVLDLKDKKLMTNRGSEKIKFLKCANVNFTKVEDIEVTPKITEQFQEMLENRTGVFVEPNEALPYNTNFIGTIRTVNDDPIYSKLYPYPIGVSDFVTQAMLRDGLIRPSQSPYNNPVWVVDKKGPMSRETQNNV